MLTEEEQLGALDKIARRWKHAQARVSEAKATKDALKTEIKAIMADLKMESQVITESFVINDMPESRRALMVKNDFITKYSPPVLDSEGNPLVHDDGSPILDRTVGAQAYEEHCYDMTYNKFIVKKRTVEEMTSTENGNDGA